MGMVEQILDLKAEERSMVTQAVKLQIKMTSFQRRRQVFSFEEKVCPWEPGWAKLWECQHGFPKPCTPCVVLSRLLTIIKKNFFL